MLLQRDAEELSAPAFDTNIETAATLLRIIFAHDLGRVHLRLWDGSELGSYERAGFTIVIPEPGALRAAFSPPIDLNAGRAVTSGLLECEGDLEAAVDAMYGVFSRHYGTGELLRIALLLQQLPKSTLPCLREASLQGKIHSIARDRAAVGFHYNLPVEFFATFLDRQLVYSCAYYDDGITDLDDAQTAKLDYVLHKLRLQPGERLLDIGCGWGALVVRAAAHFGANVLGITLSERQRDEARRRIHEAGLDWTARVELLDYRELQGESFDKIASVGMFEHVGKEHLSDYFRSLYRLLAPKGLLLNHGIANQNPTGAGGKSTGFMGHFIFPDGELVQISEALHVAERVGFEVRDVENLREHYVETLRTWGSRLEDHREEATNAADEYAYRAWRLYLAGSAQGFRVGRIGLFQSLLAKPAADGSLRLPNTRRDLYNQADVGKTVA